MCEERESKAAQKRAAHDAEALGKRLTELSPAELATVPLGEELRQALAQFAAFGSHGARRRQLKFIGKRLRKDDTEAIEAALAAIDRQSAADKRSLHELERWRDLLVADRAALTEFVQRYPGVDVQRIRQQVAAVQRARAADAKAHASGRSADRERAEARALFRLIRDAIQGGSEPAD